jgi:hypothetical protein
MMPSHAPKYIRWLHPSLRRAFSCLYSLLITPSFYFYRIGHMRSAFAAKAMTRDGKPLPWYAYPAIFHLLSRDFSGRRVLEFGAGQSTLWWAGKAQSVTAFERDERWFKTLSKCLPPNARLILVDPRLGKGLKEVTDALHSDKRAYDVVIIDGLWRKELIPAALSVLSPDGALICDNSEGYDFYETLRGSGLQRVDFFGIAPGVVRPHATSIYFGDKCFLFQNNVPILLPLL